MTRARVDPDVRLRRAVGRWPTPAARALEPYLTPATRPRRSHGPRAAPQYWMRLPRWLHAQGSARDRPHIARRALDDILWGQRALFLFVRIHDDLFDGQVSAPGLVYAADLLLLESARAFADHVDRGFWPVYHRCLSTTLTAILEVDALQRSAAGMPPGSVRLYARVSAIFKVGSVAILQLQRRERHQAAVARFADEVAIADQIVDDLVDLEEDLRRGRLNHVASRLLRQGTDGPRARGDRRARIARAIEHGGLAETVQDVRHRLARARQAVAPLRLTEAERFLAALDVRVAALGDHLHRLRVLDRLGRLVPTPRRAGHAAFFRAASGRPSWKSRRPARSRRM